MTVQGEQGSWGKTVPIAVHDILVLRFHGPSGNELLARFT
jgi:hypothetical protein